MKSSMSFKGMYVVLLTLFLMAPGLATAEKAYESVDENSLYVRMGV